MKCVLLDLQGPEEIGLLTYCSNYSLGMALIASLRSLTYGDVFDADDIGHLEQVVDLSRAHRAITNIVLGSAKQTRTSKSIRLNHVFRWTHSSLAVSEKAYLNPYRSGCEGYVGMASEIQIAPGHYMDALELISADAKKRNLRTKTKRAADLTCLDNHLFKVGIGDITCCCSSDRDQSKIPLVWLPFAIETINRYHNTFGPSGSSPSQGRDVIDIVNNIEIPIPKMVDHSRNRKDLLFGNKMKPHFAPLLTLLPKIQQRLFYSDSNPRTSKKPMVAAKGKQLGRMSMKRLTKIPKTYGVPISLRRTTEWLFSDFATLIADPFLFDTALDMYDTFCTLHRVLTQELKLTQGIKLRGQRGIQRSFIHNKRNEQLSGLVEAIRNSLLHRIAKAYPEISVREMAIDFHGGLNQIL